MSAFLIAVLPLAFQQAGDRIEVVQTLAPDFALADHRLIDLDSATEHGAVELVLLGAGGQVRV